MATNVAGGKLMGSSVKNFYTKKSNRSKKLRTLKHQGVDGLIEKNRIRREKRDANQQSYSQNFARCEFECVGVRKGLVRNGKVFLTEAQRGEITTLTINDAVNATSQLREGSSRTVLCSDFTVDEQDLVTQSNMDT